MKMTYPKMKSTHFSHIFATNEIHVYIFITTFDEMEVIVMKKLLHILSCTAKNLYVFVRVNHDSLTVCVKNVQCN